MSRILSVDMPCRRQPAMLFISIKQKNAVKWTEQIIFFSFACIEYILSCVDYKWTKRQFQKNKKLTKFNLFLLNQAYLPLCSRSDTETALILLQSGTETSKHSTHIFSAHSGKRALVLHVLFILKNVSMPMNSMHVCLLMIADLQSRAVDLSWGWQEKERSRQTDCDVYIYPRNKTHEHIAERTHRLSEQYTCNSLR